MTEWSEASSMLRDFVSEVSQARFRITQGAFTSGRVVDDLETRDVNALVRVGAARASATSAFHEVMTSLGFEVRIDDMCKSATVTIAAFPRLKVGTWSVKMAISFGEG